MLKLYKDLYFAYWLVAIVGVFALAMILAFESIWVFIIFVLLWVLACAIVFHIISNKRFNKIIISANNTCNVQEGLNRLYGIYKGRTNNRLDLIVAIYIGNFWLHLGRYELALNILLQYDPQLLLKAKNDVMYKLFYYTTVSACYKRLDRKECALDALDKADEALKSPHFNNNARAYYEISQAVNRTLTTDDTEKCELSLALLEQQLSQSDSMLAKVICRHNMVIALARCNRADGAREHIDFIAENGGDTVYARCARENNFSNDFIKQINLEKLQFNPAKTKILKTVVASVAAVVAMIAVTVIYGVFTAKTLYVNDYNGQVTESTYTYNIRGELVSWEMEHRGYYESESELELQHNLCSSYLYLNKYKGCEVILFQNNGVLNFHLFVDYTKTTDEVNVELNNPATDKEFVEMYKNGEYRVTRYKQFLGVTVFDGIVE